MFLRVDMVSVQVLVIGGVAEINPTFFVLACPAMFCSVARTGFAKTTVIVVEWRCIVGMQWQSGYLIVRVGCKILVEQKVFINLLLSFIVHLSVPFIR